MTSKIYQQFYEPFPQEVERSLKKGGASLTYIPVSEVITRLNKVLGVDKWNSTILCCERDTHDPDFIVAHVRLTAEIEGSKVTKDGVGGQKIKRTKNGDIVDLGDEFKGAVSDALKKAAQQLGIGLYLARTEDALEIEAFEAEQELANPLLDQFMSLRAGLSEEKIPLLREYWNDWSDGRPVPKPSEFTEEELKVLIAECIRLEFDAEYVIPEGEEESD